MKASVPWFLLAAFLMSALPLQASSPSYTQDYSIFIRGVLAGSENVKEDLDKDGNLVSTSESEIFINDGLETKRMAFVTRMVLSKRNMEPISYSLKYTSGESKDSYEVTVKASQATRVLNRGGRVSELTMMLQPDAVILDFSVYHQYDYLVRKYDFKRGGRQSFHNFIPIIGAEIPMALTQIENSNLQHAKGTIPVRNFKIDFVGIWAGNFSVDNDGRLVRLTIREQDLEIVRKDLAPESVNPSKEGNEKSATKPTP